MNRREAIQKASLALGYTLSGPLLAGVLQGCKATPELPFVPQYLSPEQAYLISRIVDIIIPKTDTPGAVEAGVPGFIDVMLKDVYTEADKTRITKGLAEFDKGAEAKFGRPFGDLSNDDQVTYLKQVHDEVLSTSKTDTSFGWWRAGGGEGKPFIVEIKELTLLGFFTSKPGATEVLQYNQVPGVFRGCVPLSEVGKTWAT
jgi:hypothetical protein